MKVGGGADLEASRRWELQALQRWLAAVPQGIFLQRQDLLHHTKAKKKGGYVAEGR